MDQDPTTTKLDSDTEAVHEVDSNYTKHDIKIPREKKHTGLIIGIVIAVLVLLCGGLALWFGLWYSNPEQVAYDAVNQLIKAENVGFEGGLSFINPDEDGALKMILVSFDSASNTVPNSTSAKVQLVFNPEQVEGEPRVLLEAKNVVMRDGVIYLQVSGIMDSIESLGLDEDTRASLESYLSVLEVIDNEWWQISVPDLLEELELPGEQTTALTEVYQCAVQAMNSDMSGEVATIYKQNQFVQVQARKQLSPDGEAYSELAAGHKAYELTLDKGKLASFVNQLPETKVVEGFFACYNNVASQYGGEKIDASDIPEIDADDVSWPDADQMQAFLEISKWDHKLRSATIFLHNDEGQDVGGGTIEFKYDPVTVTSPESYRPISELFNELAELFNQVFSTSMEDGEEV